ncbi:MAG TPA: SIS domain-containing protein, partial [Thermomicrobiales bacterium]|nr:SIS domain-containing protein [Thermomicrobiales bacterium]
EHFMREYSGGMQAQAVHSFDFVLYGPPLTDRDAVVVVSHTGGKNYSVEALQRVRGSAAPFGLVTGEAGAARHDAVEHLFITTPPEGSATYTFSYTSALAVLAQLAGRIGAHRSGTTTLEESLLTEEVPAAMQAALGVEAQMRELAARHLNARHIWLSGGGPAGVTAMEVALKIKEAAYLMAEGIPTEQMLHGPFQASDPQDLMVLVAPAGPAQPRTKDLAAETKEVGLDLIVVSDGSYDGPADASVSVPPVPEPFAAITTLIPLHLFAYWLAIERGTNPDRFRLDDERFARAFALTTL